MRSVIKKLCLIGLEPIQEAEVARRIILTNAIAWLAGLLTLPQTVYYAQRGDLALVLSALAALASFLTIPLLNWFHHHLMARVGLMAVCTIAISISTRYLASDIGLSLFYFPLSVVPFYLFTNRERMALPMALVPVVAFFLTKTWEPAWTPNLLNVTPAIKTWLRSAMWLECFAALLVPAFLQFKLGARSALRSDEEQLKRIQSSRVLALVEMSGGLAHEINNPLAILKGNAEQIRAALVRTPPDVAKAEACVASIQANVERISRTMQALKSIAREGDAAQIETISASKLITEVLGLCEKRVQDFQIELVVDCNSKLQFEANSTQLSQVLFNLIANAVHAVAAESERWIRVGAREVSEEIEITVTDSGKGIPRAIRDRIMDPFFTTKQVGEAMGVGLAISRSFVEGHGGSLTYDTSSPNTRFVVRLPRRRATRALRAA